MKWFKHDSDAHRDAKIEKLIIKFGLEGYGLYFYCLELIASDISENSFTFELEHDAEIIGRRVGLHPERIEEMMRYLVDSKLFELNNGRIACMKLLNRLDLSMTSNKHMREVITKAKSCLNHDIVMTESCKSRVDKNRLDKIKEKSSRFAPPSHAELSEFISDNCLSVIADDFINFYQSKNWMVGKNKMKDWKAAARMWHSRNKTGGNNGQRDTRSRAQKVSDKLDEIARADIEANGFTSSLD